MINWKNYIDKVYIINCAKHDKERTANILAELKRIGITDDLIYNYYNIENKLVNIPVTPELENCQSVHEYNVTLGHYYCMKQAQEFNYEKIMIVENDIVFLQDLNIIQQLLDIVNENIYKYDIISNGNVYDFNLSIFNNDINGEASINFYSKQGYQKIIDVIENKYMIYIDGYIQFSHENIYTGRLTLPIGVQSKLMYDECFNQNIYLYNFSINDNTYKGIFESYVTYMYNYLCLGIYMIGRDNHEYYKHIKNLINSYSYYNADNKYDEDIKYVDYLYSKYVLYEEPELIDFEKCLIFNDQNFRIDELQILYKF